VASEDGGAGPPSAEAAAGPPVCYRHTDRETYVTCSRCERPICPDCMISASVGFQCPECVREGNKTIRQPRTVLGGRLHRDNGLVTQALIAVNVVIFLLVQTDPEAFLNRFVLRAYTGDPSSPGIAEGGWYRLFTAAFLHQQTLHILFNMIMLYMFGRPLEAYLGRARFLGLYLIAALGGSTASYLFNSPAVGSLGASGAVIGLVGALLVVERRMRSNTPGVLIYLTILLLPGLLVHGIDWRAHVGGLITGGLLGAVAAYAPAKHRNAVQFGAAIATVIVLVVLVVMRTHHLDGQFGQGF
jgi:membrane associated rhomboid family serine protease